jgi:hypothetical protein
VAAFVLILIAVPVIRPVMTAAPSGVEVAINS